MLNDHLRIPDYQRPYKWQEHHVNQFIQDLITHADKEQYRIGNMVLHVNEEKNAYDIVDGQQRFITLLLILNAINDYQNGALRDVNKAVQAYLKDRDRLSFSNRISKANIYQNNQVIKQHESELYRIRRFLMNSVEIVQFVLDKQSEAFQFFDSQNARGKDLFPHDLLKAFHLREFPENEEELKEDAVEVWEDMQSKELANLFEHYLYRIRAWSKGQEGWYFTKSDIDWFKGVNIEKTEDYPYINTYKLVHNRIDELSNVVPSYFGSREYIFPFQLDQLILNGRRFFEMVSVYKSFIDDLTNGPFAEDKLDETSQDILHTIYNYEKANRTGDTYVRNLFLASLIYYVDRFGTHGLSEAVKRLFVWSYRKRLEMFAVRVETVANHATDGFHQNNSTNAFRVIRDAVHHHEVRNLVNTSINNPKRGTSELVRLMEDLQVKIGGGSDENPE
ncbi:MAG: DUF262 domain-containing protein [Bacteroidota bacterium]